MDSLPPDPYKALGISKDADLAQIRSAHRKLVLKCHPDKVQDPDLKAAKQDEFQAVQQAYELLSDEKRRLGYDEKVKLFELRKEMGRGNPTPRSNPFEYEIRTAEPRTTSTTYSKPPPKVYSHPPPRSYEDFVYEEPRSMPRKTNGYEEKKRPSTRDDDRERDRRRYEEDERAREKAARRSEKSAHSDKKKSRDKERRRGTEEKTRSKTTAYVESGSESDYRPPLTRSSDKKSRHKMEEEIRQREEAARAAQKAREREQRDREREREREKASIKTTSMDPKWEQHKDFAGQYMQAARRKADPDFHPGVPRRAETFAAPISVRYTTSQQYSDEEMPRRSSARKEARRSPDIPLPRTSSRDKSKTSRRSPPRDAYIVEPPSPPPVIKKPTLQSYSSAPPTMPTSSRKEPSRSKTQEYPRSDKTPPLPRASTFTTTGDRGKDRGGSRLKQQVYTDSDSESDSPVYASPRYSHSPPRQRASEPTRYIIDNGKSVPIKSRNTDHRTELRNSDNDPYIRERSESPRGHSHHPERPSLPRQSSDRSRAVPTRSQSQNYYPPEPPTRETPIVVTARPKMSPRENSSHRSPRSGGAGGYFVSGVNGIPGDAFRRGSDPSHHRGGSYEGYGRSAREQIYA